MQRMTLMLACVGCASLAGAQVGPMPFDPADLQTKMTAAMAAANKPGDPGMECDAIQKELVATVKDPAVQAAATRQSAAAQQQIAKLNDATAASGTAAAEMAMGFASALTPVMGGMMPPIGGASTAPAQAAQLRAMQAQAAVGQQFAMTQMQEMMTILPQLLRSQRLVELASTKKCQWAPALTPPQR